jgi:hypothetical protein
LPQSNFLEPSANMKAILFCCLGILVCVVSLCAREQPSPDLVGRVNQENGTALAKATVFVYSAGPKQGTASVCPYCYADCRKKAITGPDGSFKIESLDPQLLFRLLIVAGGYQPKFVPKVDPGSGEVVAVMKTARAESLKSKNRIAGMVVAEDGKPVVGAVISPEGVERANGTQWGGTDDFVDPLAVADEKGQFLLLCKTDIDAVQATVVGPNVAKRWVQLKPGRDHLIRMREGVNVTGQIERGGKPLKDVVVGLSTTDRTCGKFFNCDELATDKEGRFLVPNVPPGREFALYSKMNSLHELGFTPGKVVTTGDSGTTLDVGKLSVQHGYRLSGRIVLSDGAAIPPQTRLFLGREKAWDNTEAELDDNGRFEFLSVPPEPVSLSVRIKGYKFSKRNSSLDWLNGGIVGMVDGDITNLDLLLEPGQWQFNQERLDLPSGTDMQPSSRPLRGAKE